MNSLVEEHDRKRERIQADLRRFYERGIKVKIYHGSTNSVRAQQFEPDRMIDTTDLNRIIEINKEERYVLVEPNVPMDALVRESVKHGLVPPVVPEFPGITVGGAVQGGAGESSSFKYGGVHECCEEYEMLLGSGEVVRASRQERADLFWGTAGSYGSLGVMTMIKMRLVPATKYVCLRYQRYHSVESALEAVRQLSRSSVDFIDGIIFSEDRTVVMSGVRTDTPAARTARFSRAWDEWFYLHVQTIGRKYESYEETIPLQDYLFRYDRGGFWVGWYGFKRWSVPFNRLTRLLFNPFLKTRELYDILHATNTSQQFIVQDICVPEERAQDFLDFVRTRLSIYPLWILPIKPDALTPLLSPPEKKVPFAIDIGVWGDIPGDMRDYALFLKLNRDMEQKTQELGGRKILYAHTFYPKEEFWQIYDRSWYETLRKKYHAERTFPDVWEKVYVGDRYQSRIRSGLRTLIYRKLRENIGMKVERHFIASKR
ncbi:MAG: FAD-binding oxidoreductase [Candidatus Kaiserbacteria bacterium]|nr:MAG: FAD-binding oxidoreductase [Candidatus Kaiserbacteria bacterium]